MNAQRRARFPAFAQMLAEQNAMAKRFAQHRQRDHAVALLAKDDNPVPLHRRAPVDQGATPTAERAQWRDPDDTNPLRREPKLVRGYRHDVLRSIHERSGDVKRVHLLAAEQLRNAWESGQGLTGAQGIDPSGVRSAPQPGNYARHDAIAWAQHNYEQAMKSVPVALHNIIIAVVLNNRTVKDWAICNGKDPNWSAGRLVAALDCLASHYAPPVSGSLAIIG